MRTKRPVVMRITEMVAEQKPVWKKFVVDLGYTEEQGAAFADAYAAEVAKLPLVAKMEALAKQDDRCMAAGFKAAGIDEDEAFARAHA